MGTNTITRGSSTALTWTSLANLASSSTMVAGAGCASVTSSANVDDVEYHVKITHGTTPTVNTPIELYMIARGEDGTWPNGFGATDAAETKVGQNASIGVLLKSHLVTATSSAVYDFTGSFKAAGVATIPAVWKLWLVHSNVAAIAASGHAGTYTEVTRGY